MELSTDIYRAQTLRAIHTEYRHAPVRTPPIEPFSLKIPALRLAETRLWWPPGGFAQLQFVVPIPVWGIIFLLLCTITRPCSYSSVQQQMRKNLIRQGSLHSFAQSFPITSAPGDILGTALPPHEYLGFSPHKQVTADYYRMPCKCFSIAARYYSHASFVNLSHDGASQWCLSGIHRRIITKLQPDLSPKTRSKSLKHDPSLTHSIHY